VRAARSVAALATGLICFATAAQAGAPSLLEASTDATALAAFLDDCADRLTDNDAGLARVARICPGIDYAIAHGPLSSSLRFRSWPADLDPERLHSLARLARAGAERATITLDPDRLRAELDRINVQQSERRGWWQRLRDRIDDWLSFGSSSVKLPDWLRTRLDQLHLSEQSIRWIGLAITRGVPVAVFVVLLIFGLRRAGVLRRRSASRSGSGESRASEARDAPSEAARGSATLAERFAALLVRLESRGLIPNARALTCRELARTTSGRQDLETLGPIARTIERLRYSDAAPPAEVIASAQTQLEALALTQGLNP